jgi:hypothetical protein
MREESFLDTAYLASRETSLVIDSDLEDRVGVLDFHDGGSAQVAVGIITVAESKAVDTAVTLEVCRAVVQESADASTLLIQLAGALLKTGTLVGRKTYPAAMCINDKRESIELADSIDARGANPGLSILCIP